MLPLPFSYWNNRKAWLEPKITTILVRLIIFVLSARPLDKMKEFLADNALTICLITLLLYFFFFKSEREECSENIIRRMDNVMFARNAL